MGTRKIIKSGDGTLYFSTQKNKWVFQYQYKGIRRGTVQRKGETLKDFKARITELQNDINTDLYTEPTDVTLGELCQEIVEDKRSDNTICDNTYKRALYTLSYIQRDSISQAKIQDITARMIKIFLHSMTPYAQTTINKVYQLLSQTFRRAVDRNYIVHNPMLKEEAKKPKSNKQTKVVESLTIEQEKKLISILSNEERNHKYGNIILLMLFTGLRVGEVLALRYNYIKQQLDMNSPMFKVYDSLTRDSNDKFIVRPESEAKMKTVNSKRFVDITPEVRSILNNCLLHYAINPDNLLFYDPYERNFITPPEINSYLIRLNNKYKIAPHLHNHLLRHTFATRLIEAGTDIDVIKSKLGHSKIETTMNIYCDLLEARKNRQNELISDFYREHKIVI